MKIALITFGNEENYGMLFVGGELLGSGHEIRYFDSEMNNVVEQVLDWQPEHVFFSTLTTFFPKALEIAGEIKKKNREILTVFGGHHATACPEISELNEIDIVVVGPARGATQKILNGEKGIIKSLPTTPSDLPTPAREEYYRDIPRIAKRYRKIMLSTLGCPWSCSYCSSASAYLRNIFGSKSHEQYFLARRPLNTIIAEAKAIKKYDTAEIEWVDDDIFSGADVENWIPEFVSRWEKEIGLPIYVSTSSHFTLKVSDTVLSTLKRIVNCVGMGIQAIRPESLKLLNRSWDNEKKMKEAYERLRSFGYAVNPQCIVGLPVSDPVEDALDTIRSLRRIAPRSIVSCYPLQVYPGTQMEEYCKTNGFALNPNCAGDTNTGIPAIKFEDRTIKKLRNICKLATLFVKYDIDENWMRALIDIDLDEETSKDLSIARYHDCVIDRLKKKGEEIFEGIIKGMNIRY